MGKGSGRRTCDVDKEEQRDLALRAQLDEVRRLQRGRREQDPVVRDDAHFVPVDVRESLITRSEETVSEHVRGAHHAKREEGGKGRTVIIVVPYSFLNSRKRLPSTTRAMTSRMSNGWRTSVPTIPCSSSAGYRGASTCAAGYIPHPISARTAPTAETNKKNRTGTSFLPAAPRSPTIPRAIASACASSRAR